MIRWNASKSNEAIDREQAIAKLRKLTRYCKWATICTAVALALGLLAVIAIYDLLILPSLSQGFCLQSVELEAGEGPILALVGADEHTPLMLVAHDGHTAIGSAMMTCLAFAIVLSAYKFFSAIEKAGRPFDLECIRILRQIGHLFLIGGVAVKLLGAIVTADTLRIWRQLYGCAWRPAPRPLYGLCRLIISLIASVFQYGCILQKQDDELL